MQEYTTDEFRTIHNINETDILLSTHSCQTRLKYVILNKDLVEIQRSNIDLYDAEIIATHEKTAFIVWNENPKNEIFQYDLYTGEHIRTIVPKDYQAIPTYDSEYINVVNGFLVIVNKDSYTAIKPETGETRTRPKPNSKVAYLDFTTLIYESSLQTNGFIIPCKRKINDDFYYCHVDYTRNGVEKISFYKNRDVLIYEVEINCECYERFLVTNGKKLFFFYDNPLKVIAVDI